MYVLRDDIINYIDCDVYFVSETHLKEGEKIDVKDYTWDGQSRKINVKKHQKRVMGGVGFLIKNIFTRVTILNVLIINTREYLLIHLLIKTQSSM